MQGAKNVGPSERTIRKRVSNFHFLVPISLVQWHGEIGVCYDNFKKSFLIIQSVVQ